MTRTAELTVDFARPLGRLRALHGVGNGPFVAGGHSADMFARHREAGFPSVRLHDCHWPNPNVVDINTIFPLFHADENDPRNYIFAPTDRYLLPIVENGAEIVYRLGVSIEHMTQFFIHPPADFEKWARVCINILRHYNEGWADGFHYNIRQVEIWNEPNIGAMWQGTVEQYFELYRVAVTALKAYNPDIQVGGPVSTHIQAEFVRPFLAFCRDHALPLDILSWHCYRDDPRRVVADGAEARALLDEYGYPHAQSFITEWRPMLIGWDETRPSPERPANAVRDAFARNRNHEAAAYTAAVLMLLQDGAVDMTHYYCADDSPWSMFDEYGVPGKAYFAMKAFNELTKTPNRVAVAGPDDPAIVACAALADDNQSAGLLISNFRGDTCNLTLNLQAVPWTGDTSLEAHLLDADHELEPVAVTATLSLPPNTIWFIRLTQA